MFHKILGSASVRVEKHDVVPFGVEKGPCRNGDSPVGSSSFCSWNLSSASEVVGLSEVVVTV